MTLPCPEIRQMTFHPHEPIVTVIFKCCHPCMWNYYGVMRLLSIVSRLTSEQTRQCWLGGLSPMLQMTLCNNCCLLGWQGKGYLKTRTWTRLENSVHTSLKMSRGSGFESCKPSAAVQSWCWTLVLSQLSNWVCSCHTLLKQCNGACESCG